VLIPREGACGALSAKCDCYPYCMAARMSGGTTAPLIFYSAEQWKGNVYLLGRDCNVHQVAEGFNGVVSGALSGASGVTSVQVADGVQFVAGSGGEVSCLDNLLVTSIIDRGTHPVYETPQWRI